MGGFVKVKDEQFSTQPVSILNSSANSWPIAANLEIPADQDSHQNFDNIQGSSEFTPHYVALDGKVLRFEAYIREDVPTMPGDKYRIRQFTIFYFLVDDSIRIGEAKQVMSSDIDYQECAMIDSVFPKIGK